MKLVLFILCLIASTLSHAEIGSVTEMSGAASIKRGKDTITVVKGSTVEQNDKIETKNGKVKITFKDSTVVSVTEHSALVIDDFVYDPKSTSGKLNLKATAGTVRYVSGAIAHNDPKAVNIKTPTAAIAVRGTDFVMSVNETGSSMVILMPTCDWESSAIKGLICGSGSIEVESGPTIIKLDRPYQATMVETAGQPPSPPITVNLFNTPVGNNLQISPPKTMSGANVVAAARAAVASAGIVKDAKKDAKEDKDVAPDEKQAVADKKAVGSKKAVVAGGSNAAGDEEKTVTVVEEPKVETNLADSVASSVTISQSQTTEEVASVAAADPVVEFVPKEEVENPFLRRYYADKKQTQILAVGYESLKSNNYANIVLPFDTKVQVILKQDNTVNNYNFNQGYQATGQIVINQVYR